MVGWPHRLDGPEFVQALGDGKDWKAWRAAVHRFAKSWTRMSTHTGAQLPCLSPSTLLWPLYYSTTDLFFSVLLA